jgi:hypothetical protein
MDKVKVKFILEQATKAQRESRGITNTLSFFFFFFFFLGPVCISSGSTSAFKAYYATLNF